MRNDDADQPGWALHPNDDLYCRDDWTDNSDPNDELGWYAHPVNLSPVETDTDDDNADLFQDTNPDDHNEGSLGKLDQAMHKMIDSQDLTEKEKIQELRILCQDGANINAQEDESVLVKAIKADSLALVEVILELRANVNQRIQYPNGRRDSPLQSAANRNRRNTSQIIKALFLAGADADIAEVWPRFATSEGTYTEEDRLAYYDKTKILLLHSRELESTICNEALREFWLLRSAEDHDSDSKLIILFDVMKMFMKNGADLFYEPLNCLSSTAENLIVWVHKKGKSVMVCDLLQEISPVEKRLEVMSRFAALGEEKFTKRFKWNWVKSPNILAFKKVLDEQILAIKQIRTVSRLLALGMGDEGSPLNKMKKDPLVEIAMRSTTQKNVFPEGVARNIACGFFGRPGHSANGDGFSSPPLAIEFGKKH